MSTNYVGDPTATQAPSAKPGANVPQTIVLPADADAFNAAAFAQQLKSTADFTTFLTKWGIGKGLVFHDHFNYASGAAPLSNVWSVTGATCVDDSPSGGSGVVQIGVGQTVASQGPMCIGTGGNTPDFLFRARLRTSGVTGASVWKVGITSPGGTLYFLVNGGSSTANWRVEINTVNTAPSGTIAINTTYADFDILRVSGTVTFYINGATLHSAAHATTFNTAFANMTVAGAGSVLVDYAAMLLQT